MVGRPFQKGQSGNPGGRPRAILEVQDLARQHTATAIETLVTIMKDSHASASARVAAAEAILDRAYGKPAQFMASDHQEYRPAIDLSDEELEAIVARGIAEGKLKPIENYPPRIGTNGHGNGSDRTGCGG